MAPVGEGKPSDITANHCPKASSIDHPRSDPELLGTATKFPPSCCERGDSLKLSRLVTKISFRNFHENLKFSFHGILNVKPYMGLLTGGAGRSARREFRMAEGIGRRCSRRHNAECYRGRGFRIGSGYPPPLSGGGVDRSQRGSLREADGTRSTDICAYCARRSGMPAGGGGVEKKRGTRRSGAALSGSIFSRRSSAGGPSLGEHHGGWTPPHRPNVNLWERGRPGFRNIAQKETSTLI